MTKLSRGAQKLSAKGSQAELAKKLGVSQQAVSGWVTGRCRPSGERLIAIAKAYRIPMTDWYRPGSADAEAG